MASRKKGQVWFTKELATMRKELHHSESKWLQTKAGDDHKQMRSKFLEMRQTYLQIVRRVKRSYQRSMQDKLEQELKCPKNFWKSRKRINVGNKKAGCDLQEVYDKDGNIKTGEVAVKVWREYFVKVLGESKEGTVGDEQQNGQTDYISNCDTNW